MYEKTFLPNASTIRPLNTVSDIAMIPNHKIILSHYIIAILLLLRIMM